MSTQDAAEDMVGPASGTSRRTAIASRSRGQRGRRRMLSLAVIAIVTAPLLAGCGAIGARDESSGADGEPGVVGEAPVQDGDFGGGGESVGDL